MISNANEITFRCSSLGHLMSEPKEKSPMESYLTAREELENSIIKLSTMNPQTKTAQKLLISIEKKKIKVALLEENKNGLHLSETTITHLVDIFVSAKYGRREDVSGKFLEKGNVREVDSIILLSRVKKIKFKKNDIRLYNDFIQGELDIYLGEAINKAKEVFDTKSSWSAHTFFRVQHKELNPLYEWQGHGYMDLTGAERHTVAYCLVNGTAKHIDAEKKKILWNYNGDFSDSEYIKKCKQIEKNHIFDARHFVDECQKLEIDFKFHSNISDLIEADIPFTERCYTITFERDEDKIERMHKRVADSRQFMNQFLFKVA